MWVCILIWAYHDRVLKSAERVRHSRNLRMVPLSVPLSSQIMFCWLDFESHPPTKSVNNCFFSPIRISSSRLYGGLDFPKLMKSARGTS